MPIITISRGSYSRGKEVAEALAAELDYECLSRDILVEASDRYNIQEYKLVKALHDAPSLLERFGHSQEELLSYFRSAFLSHMIKGNCVYHGLAGHFFLQNISHALKVRIIARMEDRVWEEMNREKCTRAVAQHNLKKDDAERRKWSLHLHGQDTWDSRLYDMVLCVDSLTVDDIVEIIVKTVQKKQFQPTRKSMAELERRVLLANVYARIVHTSPKTKVSLVDDTVIELSHMDGPLRSEESARQDLASQLKEEFHVGKVIYREGLQQNKNHINTFYNLDMK